MTRTLTVKIRIPDTPEAREAFDKEDIENLIHDHLKLQLQTTHRETREALAPTTLVVFPDPQSGPFQACERPLAPVDTPTGAQVHLPQPEQILPL